MLYTIQKNYFKTKSFKKDGQINYNKYNHIFSIEIIFKYIILYYIYSIIKNIGMKNIDGLSHLKIYS